jgi:hypothetical protein
MEDEYLEAERDDREDLPSDVLCMQKRVRLEPHPEIRRNKKFER